MLHLKSNPSLLRFQSTSEDPSSQMEVTTTEDPSSSPAYFVTPMDELRHLKTLVRAGKLVPPSTLSTTAAASSSSAEGDKRPRSDSASRRNSNSNSSLDSSLSMNVSRAANNVSMSAGSGGGGGGVDSQKMNQRLKEVFREKIAEYRAAVYLLFGYKVSLSLGLRFISVSAS